jgi:hypothetical protein
MSLPERKERCDKAHPPFRNPPIPAIIDATRQINATG